ncbi:hypothetical protein AVEN_61532-1 [Araneus ventricosus]|uniref:Uncharacterized protein n=1 Tax=Araneus ventricosus TaxID=182803 RepID=A0A4Y2I8B5_ARAVE|nr:hypothetical protein AVEN_61532-1 [Araneus ventricosus]
MRADLEDQRRQQMKVRKPPYQKERLTKVEVPTIQGYTFNETHRKQITHGTVAKLIKKNSNGHVPSPMRADLEDQRRQQMKVRKPPYQKERLTKVEVPTIQGES